MESELTDTLTLIDRHRAGDPRALDTLMARYYSRIERMVGIRVGPALLERESAADLVQDVLVRVVKGIERFEPRSGANWIDWVARLAENEIANHARAAQAKKRGGGLERRVRQLAETASSWDLAAESTGVADRASRREQARILDRCIGNLPADRREVILLRDYAGCSWQEVADRLGRPTPEACQELHRRACRELRERLRREGLSE